MLEFSSFCRTQIEIYMYLLWLPTGTNKQKTRKELHKWADGQTDIFQEFNANLWRL